MLMKRVCSILQIVCSSNEQFMDDLKNDRLIEADELKAKLINESKSRFSNRSQKNLHLKTQINPIFELWKK